jgi:uncharacterized protein (TIGR00255 family)
MVISMTGFASITLELTSKEGSHTNLSIMIKSFNTRFLEANFKLPHALMHLETDLLKLFKDKLRRGYIQCIVQVSNPAVFKGPVEFDAGIVKSYLTACQTIQRTFNIPGTLTIAELIILPNIFSVEEQTIDKHMQHLFMKAFEALLEQLITARQLEGKALQHDLEERIKIMHQEITKIEDRAQKLMGQRKKEIIERLTYLDKTSQDIEDIQRTTLYLELDKIDIHEEIVRFNNHLKTFKNHLMSPEKEKGRRLDFILQELNRETNTIGAKCSDSDISSFAINIKVELEKAREQVQNIV